MTNFETSPETIASEALGTEPTGSAEPIGTAEHDSPVSTETPSPADSQNGQRTERAAEKKSTDKWEPLRDAMRAKTHLQARVVKWQRNGLEMELTNAPVEGHAALLAFMPNDQIDSDPNRNIANYFGKTLPVRVTSVRSKPGTAHDRSSAEIPEILLSHRLVLDDEARAAGHEAMKNYHVGDVMEVKVKGFDHSNVKIDLGTGIDAVILTRDLSWEHVEHPYEILKRGDTIQAKVLSLDRGRRQVRMGVKQLTEDPAIGHYAEYAPGQTQTGKVTSIGQFGAELELPNELIAFLPSSEVAWQRTTISDHIKEGEEVQVKILTVDSDARRITVSRKQLIEDPMRVIEQTFKQGTDHNGTIKEITRGGLVIALDHGMEGFIPRSELSHDAPPRRLEDEFKTGKPLEGLRVIEFDRKGRFEDARTPRITLSLIAAEKEAQQKNMKEFRAKSSDSRYSLADSLAALKEKLLQQEQAQ
ncbi:MAG TPA: S1 RNA-binding domain-containing protein [Candidatus Kapabacteria bacterium]|jgi:ribosomal protein S1